MVFPYMAHVLSAVVQCGVVAWSELSLLFCDTCALTQNDAGII